MFQRHFVVLLYLQVLFVATMVNGNVISSLHQSYAMTLNVSSHHLCVHNPTVKCTELARIQYGVQREQVCGRRVQQTKVSELAIGTYPHCHGMQYYIEALWDATNSGYRIESWYDKDLDEEQVACTALNMTKARFREARDSQYTIMVMTERLGNVGPSRSFNPDVRASIQPLDAYEEQVIYAAYNSTNDRGNCKQKYVPLRGSDITNEIGQSDDGTHQLTISWNEQDNSNGYIVAIGDERCTTMNRNPPCKFVKNHTQVSFGLPSLSEVNGTKVRIYNTINYNCSDDEIGNELVHLFRGCAEDCCDDSTYYYTITLPPTTTTKGMESTTSSDSTTDSSTMGVHDTTLTLTKEPNALDPENHPLDANTTVYIVVFPIVAIILIAVIVVSLVHRYKVSKYHGTNMISSGSDNADRIEKGYPEEIPYSHPLEVRLSGITNTLNPHTLDVQTSEDEQHNYKALVIYSNNTPEEKQDSIRCDLISELNSFGIEATSHDFTCIKDSVPLWLEGEIKQATAVLCVCNKEFKEEWDNPNPMSSLQLVEPLKCFISATVQDGGLPKKFAVVLLEPCDKQYIPALYLRDCRQFMVTQADAVAKFVCNVPSYSIS